MRGGARVAWKRAEARPETEEAGQIGGKMWAGASLCSGLGGGARWYPGNGEYGGAGVEAVCKLPGQVGRLMPGWWGAF